MSAVTVRLRVVTSMAVPYKVSRSRPRQSATRQRHHAAQNRGAQKRVEHIRRPEQRAERGQQLDVTGAGRAEHVCGQQQRQPERQSTERAANRHRPDTCHRQHESPDANPIVRTFGTRRRRMSTTVAATPAPMTSTAVRRHGIEAAMTFQNTSWIVVPTCADSRHGDERHQTHEQSVLDEVLAAIVAAKTSQHGGADS